MTREELLQIAKPILFNTEMVQAILDDRKSETRRVIKDQHLRVLDSPYHKSHPEISDNELIEKLCTPRYKKGDYLYVRETWAEGEEKYAYKANYPGSEGWGWRPSIHMPKQAARIFLLVNKVWPERVQDITLDGCLNEGIILWPESFNDPENAYLQARNLYFQLWDSTIPKKDFDKYCSDADPFVWAYQFERVEV